MKKLYFLFAVIFTSGYFIKAQHLNLKTEPFTANPAYRSIEDRIVVQANAKSASTLINDTLHYFFSKHYYRNLTTPTSAPPNLSFLTIKSPYTAGLTLGYCGAAFLNSTSINVHGLEGLVMKNPGSASSAVAVKLYLCNLNAFNLPIMPPLDSVLTSVSVSTAGVWAGGTFTAPVTVNGNFAVLFKKGSTVNGDTVRLFLNNAFTSAATVPNNQKFGEGLGIIQFNGLFQLTTSAFGGTPNNDYEFIVAPYVSYNISAAAAAVTASICNFSIGSFTNTSTPMNLIENRQFNFNKFSPYWAPTNALMPVTDSIYNWAFSGSSTGTSTAKHASAYFNVLGNQTAALTVKQRRSTIGYGNTFVSDVAMTTVSVTNALAPTITVSGNTLFCTSSPAITTTLYCTGNPTFTWTAPLNTVASIVVITQTAASVVYTVLAQNGGGCTAVQLVTIKKGSIPTVSLSTSTSTFCSGATGGTTISLTGSPTGGTYSGTGVSGSVFSPPNTAGTYSPVYTYTNATTGCTNSATKALVVYNCTGINQIDQSHNVIVFPNPSILGKFSLKSDANLKRIEIFNMLGILVFEQSIGLNTLEIDLSGQPNGNYLLKVSFENAPPKTLKIVNQN